MLEEEPYPAPSRKADKPFWGELLADANFCIGAEFEIQSRAVRIVSRNRGGPGWGDLEGVEFAYTDGVRRTRSLEEFRRLVEPLQGREYRYRASDSLVGAEISLSKPFFEEGFTATGRYKKARHAASYKFGADSFTKQSAEAVRIGDALKTAHMPSCCSNLGGALADSCDCAVIIKERAFADWAEILGYAAIDSPRPVQGEYADIERHALIQQAENLGLSLFDASQISAPANPPSLIEDVTIRIGGRIALVECLRNLTTEEADALRAHIKAWPGV